jgi:hypothetical protein
MASGPTMVSTWEWRGAGNANLTGIVFLVLPVGAITISLFPGNSSFGLLYDTAYLVARASDKSPQA